MNFPPKPENSVFGIRADGTVISIGFSSLREAEDAATGLVAQGRKVEIIDRLTGLILKAL